MHLEPDWEMGTWGTGSGTQRSRSQPCSILFPEKADFTSKINNGQEVLLPPYFHNVNIIKCKKQETNLVPL